MATEINTRILPHDLEAERAVIGAVLLEPAALFTAGEHLEIQDFYAEAHRVIYAACMELQAREKPIDLVTLRAELDRMGKLEAAGGVVYLAKLTDGMPKGINVAHYAAIIRAASLRRQIIGKCRNAAERSWQGDGTAHEIIEDLQMDLLRITERDGRSAWRPAADLASEAYAEIEAAANRRMDVIGIDTGFVDLNRLTQGLHRGQMIVVAGRPGHGKTSFVGNLIANAILRRDKSVGLFTLEMTGVEIIKRILYSEAEIDSYRAGSGKLNKEDWVRLSRVCGDLASRRLFVDDCGSLSIMQLRSKAQRLAVERKVDMLAVDYLQLMAGSGRRGESREREIAEISRGLKALAKDLNIPVIVVSQLNRQVEAAQRRPQLCDLRESGAIEQDADVVLFVWRDELRKPTDENRGIAEIIIGKNRNGPQGETVRLAFIRQHTRFADLAVQADGEGGKRLWYQEE
jgi:replicative DNA helicase